MLSAAEADLVRRDSAVPGLATVLDPDAFAAAVSGAAPEADVRAAQIIYLRYKPRAYCRVTYRLDVGGSDVDLDVRACRPEDLGSWLEDGNGTVAGPLGPGRLVLDDCAVLVTVFPNDLKLPQLHHLTDPAERAQLLRELLPDRPDLWHAELRRLSYRPERRYVAELHGADGARAIVKAYTRKAYKRGKRHATAFQSRGALRVARLLGCSDDRRMLAFEWLPGRTLLDLLGGPAIAEEGVRAAGAALGAFHAQQPDVLVCWTPSDEAAYLRGLAAEVGFTCPDLAQRASALTERLGARLASSPPMHLPVHGDFSGGQVLVDGSAASIIDLDSAYCGDPADDLGKFVAQAEHCALQGHLPVSQVERARDALLDAYAQATGRPLPERIASFTASALLRRTRFPLRNREPDWPRRTEWLLERAEAILASP